MYIDIAWRTIRGENLQRILLLHVREYPHTIRVYDSTHTHTRTDMERLARMQSQRRTAYDIALVSVSFAWADRPMAARFPTTNSHVLHL